MISTEITDRVLSSTAMFQHKQNMDRAQATIDHNGLRFLFNYRKVETLVVNPEEFTLAFNRSKGKCSLVVLENFVEYLRVRKDIGKLTTYWEAIKEILDKYPPPPQRI